MLLSSLDHNANLYHLWMLIRINNNNNNNQEQNTYHTTFPFMSQKKNN